MRNIYKNILKTLIVLLCVPSVFAIPIQVPDGGTGQKYLTPGVFLLGNGINGVATTSTPSAVLYDMGGAVFNASAYGVKADGTTNDATALNNLITTVCNNGGGTIILPRGNVKLSSIVYACNNVTIRGQGKEVTNIKAGTSYNWTFYYSSTTKPLLNFSLQDLTIDLQNVSNGSAVRFNNASNTLIRNVGFKNGAAGGWFYSLGTPNTSDNFTSDNNTLEDVDMDTHPGTLEAVLVFNSKNTIINRLRVRNITSPIIGIWQKADFTTINDMFCENSSGKAIYWNVTSDNIKINNPSFNNCGGIQGAGISDAGLFGESVSNNVEIINPQIIGGASTTGGVGITVGATNNFSIRGGTIQGFTRGINLTVGQNNLYYPPTNFVISGVKIKNNNVLGVANTLNGGISLVYATSSPWYGIIENNDIYDDQATTTQKCPIVINQLASQDIKIINNRLSSYSGYDSICLSDGGSVATNTVIYGNSDYTGSSIFQTLLDIWKPTDTNNGVYYSSGRVGIGTTSPDSAVSIAKFVGRALLHVGDDVTNNSMTKLLVENRWTGAGGFGFVVQRSSAVPQFNVDGNGNVGVGTSSPGTLFSINNTANFASATSSIYSALKLLGATFANVINGQYTVDTQSCGYNGYCIQQALDSCSTSSLCGVVNLPGGNYIATTTINIPSNITIRGVGSSTIIQSNIGANTAVFRNKNFAVFDSNIRIENLAIEGNGATYGTASGIQFNGVATSTILNVQIRNTGHEGILIASSSNLRISNTEVYNTVNGYQGIAVNTTKNSRFENITVASNTWVGIGLYNCLNNTILNSNSASNTSSGILIQDSSSTLVSNNNVDRNGTGIVIGSTATGTTAHNTITGNIITNSGTYSLLGGASGFQNEYNVYTNNQIYYGGDDALVVLYNNYATVANNIVYQNGRGASDDGIPVDHSANVTVSGNYVCYHPGYGIEIKQSSPNVTVTGNIACNNSYTPRGGSPNQRSGIVIEAYATSTTVTGNISYDDQGASSSQRYGIDIQDGTSQTTVMNNIVYGNLRGGINYNIAANDDRLVFANSGATSTAHYSTLYITGTGNIGIATSSPTQAFSVSGNAIISGSITQWGGSAYAGQAMCYATGGVLGHCTGAVGGGGACTCVAN